MITRMYSFHCANVIEAANCSPGLRYKVTTWTKSSARYCPVVCCYQLVIASKGSSPWGFLLTRHCLGNLKKLGFSA